MGAVISGESEEQITCNYNEKQHQSCKDTVANQENTIKNYMDMDKAKKDTIADLEYQININENALKTARAQYEERGNELDAEKKKVAKLNDKVSRIKTACNKDTNCKKLASVQNILNEKFTSLGNPCSIIIYCVISLIFGILIGAWLFGSFNDHARKNDVKSITVNENAPDIEYISENPEE